MACEIHTQLKCFWFGGKWRRIFSWYLQQLKCSGSFCSVSSPKPSESIFSDPVDPSGPDLSFAEFWRHELRSRNRERWPGGLGAYWVSSLAKLCWVSLVQCTGPKEYKGKSMDRFVKTLQIYSNLRGEVMIFGQAHTSRSVSRHFEQKVICITLQDSLAELTIEWQILAMALPAVRCLCLCWVDRAVNVPCQGCQTKPLCPSLSLQGEKMSNWSCIKSNSYKRFHWGLLQIHQSMLLPALSHLTDYTDSHIFRK